MRWFLLATLVCATPALASESDEVTYLVPEMENTTTFELADGPRAFLKRLAFSPAAGRLGSSDYFAFRLAYNPNSWLGYEAHLGHNPAESVHALVNTLNVVVRKPLGGRLQPYATAGYGMMLVFPGAVFNADPVTKNVVGAGIGLEFYLRSDVALRGELRNTTVLGGRTTDGDSQAFHYREFTFGFSFYKTLTR